jgi:hypothetical protein
MIRRHDDLWQQFTEETPGRTGPRSLQLEVKITGMPAFTSEGLAGKRRVVRRAEFDDDDGIVAAILALDAERVAANSD